MAATFADRPPVQAVGSFSLPRDCESGSFVHFNEPPDLRTAKQSDRSSQMSVLAVEHPAMEKPMTLETVTGEHIRLSRYAGFHLQYAMDCGSDLIAQVCIVDAEIPANNRTARVYASRHEGVALLVHLARERGELKLLSGLTFRWGVLVRLH